VNQKTLMDMYKDYNDRFFNRALPTIPVKITSGTRMLACAIQRNDYSLAIHLYKRPMIELIAANAAGFRWGKNGSWETILIHEMIHIYQYIGKIAYDNHGPEFMRKLDEIEKLSGMKQYREFEPNATWKNGKIVN